MLGFCRLNDDSVRHGLVKYGIYCMSFPSFSPATEGAWNFANVNVTQAIGIMAFGMYIEYGSFHNFFLLSSTNVFDWRRFQQLSI